MLQTAVSMSVWSLAMAVVVVIGRTLLAIAVVVVIGRTLLAMAVVVVIV